MARTFTYDKRQRHHQQPPPRASWRNTTQATTKRGKYADLADLADRVHEHCMATSNRQIEQSDETPERQKRPVSP